MTSRKEVASRTSRMAARNAIQTLVRAALGPTYSVSSGARPPTAANAYTLIPKATPSAIDSIWKVRYDKVNALLKDNDVTIIDTHGTVLGDYEINPEKNYQAKKQNT